MRHLLDSVINFVFDFTQKLLIYPALTFCYRHLFHYAFQPLRNVACLTGGELYQRLRKFGKRFSTKAFIPSFWSSVAKVLWNKRRSYWTPSEREDS